MIINKITGINIDKKYQLPNSLYGDSVLTLKGIIWNLNIRIKKQIIVNMNMLSKYLVAIFFDRSKIIDKVIIPAMGIVIIKINGAIPATPPGNREQ